jgi:protein-disulfide isomerase
VASRTEDKQRAREAREAAEQADAAKAKRRSAVLRLGLVLGLAVVVVVIAIVVSSGGSKSTPPAASTGDGSSGSSDAAQVAALFKGIPQSGIDLGKPSAKATLIEFADLQCPFCAEYSNNALPTVVKDYVRTGRLRYELRLRSFLGPDSVKAAGAASAAAAENRLYQFSDLFYRRQGQENTGYVTDAFIRSVASGAGVDPAKAVAGAANASNDKLVKQAETLAKDVGSNSTPAFYLRLKGGRLVPVTPQALDGAAMKTAIDQALAGA